MFLHAILTYVLFVFGSIIVESASCIVGKKYIMGMCLTLGNLLKISSLAYAYYTINQMIITAV